MHQSQERDERKSSEIADDEVTARGVSEPRIPGLCACLTLPLRCLVGGPKAFAFWALLAILLKVASGIYTGAIISTIEKQFKLSSTESGAILMLNDAMDLSLVLFVTYFGQTRHRPRLIATGTLVAGLGMLLSAVPHLALAPYTDAPTSGGGCNQTAGAREAAAGVDMCSAAAVEGEGATTAPGNQPCAAGYDRPAVSPVVWLVLGQILLGIGNVPIKPLGTTYIDDAVGRHTTALYIAFLLVAAPTGTLVGFMLGGISLSFFVDFDRVPVEDRPALAASDPRYLGAWWLGYLVVGCATLLLSVPFFFFPRHLPKTEERLEQEAQEELMSMEQSEPQLIPRLDMDEDNLKEVCDQGKDISHLEKFQQVLKRMYRSYRKMILNGALVLLCLSSAATGAVLSAIASFVSKYNSVVLGMTDSTAPVFVLLIIPFVVGGNLIGGAIIRRWKFTPAQCALFLLFGELVAVTCAPAFLTIGCETVTLAGISAPYREPALYGRQPAATTVPPLLPNSAGLANAPCNQNCTCGDEDYNPVCGSDGLTYVSPCYAGCEVVDTPRDPASRVLKTFSDCHCIDEANRTAVDGECPSPCKSWVLPAAAAANIVLYFLGSLGMTGLPLITLRIVEADMRATALGFQTLVLNLLGYFIAPVYFGALINYSCILWGYEQGERGACWVYDTDLLRYTYQGGLAVLKAVSAVFLVGVYLCLRRRKLRTNEDFRKIENNGSEGGIYEIDHA